MVAIILLISYSFRIAPRRKTDAEAMCFEKTAAKIFLLVENSRRPGAAP
jgi:hypothetical protein